MKRTFIWKILLVMTVPSAGLTTATASSTQASPETACPDLAQGETLLDCPWADVGREISAALKEGASEARISALLFERIPRLKDDFALDRRQAALRDLWGKSLNFDESTRHEIVAPAILKSIAAGIGVPPPEDRITHAGAQHTYGYLFSIEKTPFGYKRARWVRHDIEKGFGLPRGTLGPKPSRGSLFTNITWLAARLALMDDPKAADATLRTKHQIAKHLAQIDWDALPGRRLVEKVQLEGSRTVELRTDLIPFPHAPRTPPKGQPEPNALLLVYSVRDSSDEGRSRVITLFPVQKSFADRVLDPAGMGPSRPVASRYNAWVSGLSDQGPKTGSREQLSRKAH